MASKLLRSSSLVFLAMALWTSSCLLLPTAMADHTVQPAAASSSAAAAQPSLPTTGPTTTSTLPASSSSSTAAAAAAALPSGTPAAAAVLPSGTTAAASETPTTTAAAATAPKEKFPLPTTGGAGEPDLPTPHGGGVQPDLPTPHGGVEPVLPTPHGGGVGEPYLPAAEVAGALPVPTPDELPSGASLGFGSNGGLGYGGPGDVCCGGPGGYGWFGGPGGFGPGTYGYSGPLYWGAAPATAGLERVTNVVVALVVAYASAAIFA